MTTLELSIIFFIVGVIEYFLDQQERLVSVRLKVWSTIFYSALNHIIDFFIYVFMFGILIQFWENWHSGAHDYNKLWPYVVYTLGKVVGVALSTYIFAHNKKMKDKERAIRNLEKLSKKKSHKKRSKKQKAEDAKADSETIFDSIEVEDVKDEIKARAIESATQKISEKIDAAFEEKDSK